MAVALRINTERMLTINSGFLSPRISCGLMLTKVPPYQANDVFRDVMRTYGHPNLYADKPAAKILDEDEDLMRQFCANAEANKMVLKPNFRGVYSSKEVYLALDAHKKAAYFLTAPEHKLALVNYYRDAMPNIVKILNVTLGGSTNRLTPVGWQNLHDVLNDITFRVDYPELDRIEITASLSDIRWRNPTLEIGINILNFSNPNAIREGIRKEVKGFSG
jgi:hypothetical protein